MYQGSVNKCAASEPNHVHKKTRKRMPKDAPAAHHLDCLACTNEALTYDRWIAIGQFNLVSVLVDSNLDSVPTLCFSASD